MGKITFLNSPEIRNEPSVPRVFNVTGSRQLIAALAVLSSSLSVALAGDRAVSGSGLSDTASGQHEVDIRQTVFNTFDLVFDAARMKQHGSFCRTPDFRSADDARSGNTGDGLRDLRRIVFHQTAHMIEAFGMPIDEFLIDPAAFDHHVQDSVGECAVPAWL